ncbi:MAG: methyltransferase domain-containing protein [bacterium]|nr:methyltransferase domain-containing protein [bacterium]
MDEIGDELKAPNAAWSFGGEVPKNFDAHIRRSVPLYAEGHDLVAQLTDYFVHDESLVYELGSSTGELTKKIADRHSGSGLRFVGVDREPAMVDIAREKCAGDARIAFEVEELSQFPLAKCDVVVAYYTAQFVRPKFRQALFDRVFEALNWGGAFILFEKVRAPDARFQDMMTAMYADYKLERGYSGEEIVAKTKSLKGILEPFSSRANFELLDRAGFKDCMTVMKYICFEGILAIK